MSQPARPRIFVLNRTELPWFTAFNDGCIAHDVELQRYFGGPFGLGSLVNSSCSVCRRLDVEERGTIATSLDYIITRKMESYSERAPAIASADAIFVPAGALPLRIAFQQLGGAPSCLNPPKGVTAPPGAHARVKASRMVSHAERALSHHVLSMPEVVNSTIPIVVPMAMLPFQHRTLFKYPPSNQKHRIFFLSVDSLEGRASRVFQLPYGSRFTFSSSNMSSQISLDRFIGTRKYLAHIGSPRVELRSNRSFRHNFMRVRRLVGLQLNGSSLCSVLDSTTFQLEENYRRLAQSTFSLQLPGDTPTRRGFYDSIMLGCIPVVLSRNAYRFFDFDIEDIAVVIPRTDIQDDGTDVVQKLHGISSETIRQKQANIHRARKVMQYSSYGDERFDAFNTALRIVHELAQRFTDKK
jgi:hypothetical protein